MRSRAATLELGPTGLLLHTPDGKPTTFELPPLGPDWTAWIEQASPAFATEALGPVRAVEILLRPPWAEQRTLAGLPPVSERDLRSLVLHQKTKFFRNGHDNVVVAATWDGSGDDRTARVAQADLALLEALERCATVHRRSVTRFIPVDASGRQGPALVTPGAEARAGRRRRWMIGGWLAVATSGWVATGAMYAVDLVADDRALVAELAELDAPIERIQALSDRVASFSGVADAYRRNALDSAWLSGRIALVADALPQGAHLHRLTVERDGAVRLDVHGPDVVEVIDRMTGAWPGVVRMDGPPQPEPWSDVDGAERFTVILEGPS